MFIAIVSILLLFVFILTKKIKEQKEIINDFKRNNLEIAVCADYLLEKNRLEFSNGIENNTKEKRIFFEVLNFMACCLTNEVIMKKTTEQKLALMDRWLRQTVPELEQELYRVNKTSL